MSVLPLLLALLAPHPCGSLEVPEPPQGPTEERIREAWSFLLPDERREVAEWFRLELSSLETFQLTVIRFVLDGQEMDPGFWPEDEPPPFYDPETESSAPIQATSHCTRSQSPWVARSPDGCPSLATFGISTWVGSALRLTSARDSSSSTRHTIPRAG